MEILSWLGYASALLAYACLLLLALLPKQKNVPHKTLIIFAGTGVFWSSVQLYSNYFEQTSLWINWAETFRISTTCLFIHSAMCSHIQSLKKYLTSSPALLIFFPSILLPITSIYSLLPPAWVYIGYLGLTLGALILLEILYRKSSKALWGLKPMLLGLGSLMIFDFIVFADASLIAHLNPDMWLARGYLHTALVPLIIWSLKRSKSLGINVYVSREMVFQSSLLLAAGAYLCLMALAGYYIKSIESQWTGMVQSIFIALAFTLLFALFVSETLKRNLKVFLEKNFFANQFDYRVQWLHLTNLINKPLAENEDFYKRGLQTFLFAANYDCGQLIKLGSSEPFTLVAEIPEKKSSQNIPESSKSVLNELVEYIDKTHWIIDLRDYQSNSQQYPGLCIPYTAIDECPFHVVIPIYQEDKLWGLACLNNKSGETLTFNWEIRDYMSVVTTQVGHYLFQHEANKVVTENAQFAAFNRMSAFVIHDLKNVLAQVDMILVNAEKHKHNPEFIDDTFETLCYSKKRMEKMLAQLMNKSMDEEEIDKHSIDIAATIADIIQERCNNNTPTPVLKVKNSATVNLDPEKFSNVLFHLIDNAQQATADDGQVIVELDTDTKNLLVKIIDTGTGMTGQFIREKLFKPFETTKGNAGMGIGAYDAKLFAESAGGSLQVESEKGRGTTFTLQLPI
ncbi:XrtA/PEP-CTERM system histidine kinase PrsK [Catenovulum sediminis]|uniref:histidine kinase n=1 Tax=Catenovulum sediminis TaxID=1740262 RepID=A0ABV1RFR8_9ALTE|nr:XrtA/PEP-CTERM system histidine kinase PrsK [Catenovulum sediminis]